VSSGGVDERVGERGGRGEPDFHGRRRQRGACCRTCVCSIQSAAQADSADSRTCNMQEQRAANAARAPAGGQLRWPWYKSKGGSARATTASDYERFGRVAKIHRGQSPHAAQLECGNTEALASSTSRQSVEKRRRNLWRVNSNPLIQTAAGEPL